MDGISLYYINKVPTWFNVFQTNFKFYFLSCFGVNFVSNIAYSTESNF